MKINLNQEWLYLSTLQNGMTQNIELKIGRKIYLCDIEKCNEYACIEMYDRVDKDRTKFSKYGGVNLHWVNVKSNAYLTRKFFEYFIKISEAQKL